MVAVVVGHAHGSAVVGRLEDRPVIGAEREELTERIIAREVGVVESVLRIIVVELDLHAVKGNCVPLLVYKPAWIAYDADRQIPRSIVGQVVIACFPIAFDFAILVQIERTCRNENFYKAIRKRLGIDKHRMVALKVHEAEFGFGKRSLWELGYFRPFWQNKATAHIGIFKAAFTYA